MGFSNDLSSKLRKATDTATKKVEELTGVAKLNLDIYNLKGDLEDLYRDLGKAVYLESHAETKDEEVINQLLEKIEEKIEELKELEKKQSEFKRIKVCHTCGYKNSDENIYCAMCGNKL